MDGVVYGVWGGEWGGEGGGEAGGEWCGEGKQKPGIRNKGENSIIEEHNGDD